MNLTQWSKSSVGYGRKLVNSAIAGARTGEDEFLKEDRLAPFLGDSARHALMPAAVGTGLGLLCGYFSNDRRSTVKTLACGVVGGTLGFGVGMIWESRKLTASVASSMRKSVKVTRDEHWFEENPIDYA